MKRTQKETGDEYFNAIPHSLKDDFWSGKISVPEKNILLHLRLIADKHGCCYVSVDDIRKDVFSNKVRKGTINDHFLKLKKKGCLWYEERKGSGGTFKVYLDKWLLKNNVWLVFDKEEGVVKNGSIQVNTTEVTPEVIVEKRNSNHPESIEFPAEKLGFRKGKYGGGYKDIDKDIKSNDRISNKEVRVQDFVPNSDIDDKLKRIAKLVGEEYMGFVFWVYGKKGDLGVSVMEKVSLDLIDRTNVHSKQKYFNSEVRRRLGLLQEENSKLQ